MRSPARAKALPHTDAPRPAPGIALPTPTGGRPTKTERPQRLTQRGSHPITIMSPTRRPARSRTEISMGARAHRSDDPSTRNHSPPTTPDPHLTAGPCTDKRKLRRLQRHRTLAHARAQCLDHARKQHTGEPKQRDNQQRVHDHQVQHRRFWSTRDRRATCFGRRAE